MCLDRKLCEKNMINIISCVVEAHDPRLVALSAGICILGCFATATLMAQSQASGECFISRWTFASAGVFGCSVWSLHFVAMLAFL